MQLLPSQRYLRAWTCIHTDIPSKTWTGNGTDNRSRVWVSGVRNPYRVALKPDSIGPGPGTLDRQQHLAGLEEVRLIPVPSEISSDCGVTVRFLRTDLEKARALLTEVGDDLEGMYILSDGRWEAIFEATD